MKLYGKDYGPKAERCPGCLGHGFIAHAPGAYLSVKIDPDSTCKFCKGEGVIFRADAAVHPLSQQERK